MLELGRAPGLTNTVLGVEVEEGPVPDLRDTPIVGPPYWADSNRFLVRSEVASLYVAGGSEVVVEVATREARLHHDFLVYAHAARALLWQRRRFNIHATLVVDPAGRGVALSGSSGVGKSTTTLELVRRGWTFACDDVVELTVGPAAVVAQPYARPIHLADHVARAFGVDPAWGRALPQRDKRVYAIEGDLTPRGLSSIVCLEAGGGAGASIERLDAAAALPRLMVHSDGRGVCRLPRTRAQHFAWCAGALSSVPFHVVTRPSRGDSVAAVADLVVQSLS